MDSKDSVDVESLQKRGAHCRWLDRCLVLSVVVLFAGLAALAAAGVLMANKLQSKMQTLRVEPEPEMSNLIGNAYVNIFKAQNFAYLESDSPIPLGNPETRSLQWTGKTVGSNFVLNPKHHDLKVKESGSYFLYVELNLTCASQSQTGFLRFQVAGIMNCDVHHLSCSQHQPIVHKCWAVRTLSSNTVLEYTMSNMLPSQGLDHDPKPTVQGVSFGMFLVG